MRKFFQNHQNPLTKFLRRAKVSSMMLKVNEVAARLNVSNKTVYNLIKQGQFPVHKFNGSYRVAESDLDRYIQVSRHK